MLFNQHYTLVGRHAFLSASKYHWVRYSDEKLDEVFANHMTAQLGTRLHAFASEAILLGLKQPRTQKTLNMYINDAIGYRMTPEQILYYSDNAFGTCDAISFRRNVLRIHDLKNGVTAANRDQLLIYAAFFFLEYKVNPSEVETELRIYQNDEVKVHNPELDEIVHFMDRVITANKRIELLRAETLG